MVYEAPQRVSQVFVLNHALKGSGGGATLSSPKGGIFQREAVLCGGPGVPFSGLWDKRGFVSADCFRV